MYRHERDRPTRASAEVVRIFLGISSSEIVREKNLEKIHSIQTGQYTQYVV